MASSKDYLEFILDQLSGLAGVTYRPMMSEYIIYFNGKIIGGIYDNRFLVKCMDSAKKLMPQASLTAPYPGAKDMILVDNVDDRVFLESLLTEMGKELSASKR